MFSTVYLSTGTSSSTIHPLKPGGKSRNLTVFSISSYDWIDKSHLSVLKYLSSMFHKVSLVLGHPRLRQCPGVHHAVVASRNTDQAAWCHRVPQATMSHIHRTVKYTTGIILGMGLTSEGPQYVIMSSLIGWTHSHNDPWTIFAQLLCFIISFHIIHISYNTCIGHEQFNIDCWQSNLSECLIM